ncbi:MAG TPA: hypothetical protein VH020_05675 [Stellaceae bacterium]|jgi:hypothetical protein|nr:hypothetical protein [Stellaceae bacterium]
MTYIIDTKSKRHLPATLAAGLAISAFLVLGTFVSPVSAEEHHGGGRGGHAAYHGGGHRGGYGGGYGGWDGGYYGAPPVVYGAPYYDAPPVVYGPGIGVALPGIGISIN